MRRGECWRRVEQNRRSRFGRADAVAIIVEMEAAMSAGGAQIVEGAVGRSRMWELGELTGAIATERVGDGEVRERVEGIDGCRPALA
jgi:hypothetical protein